MKKIFLSLSVITAFTLASCGGEEKSTSTEAPATTETAEEVCFYTYNEAAGTQVRWTAFKTTEKKPVGGQFDQVNVSAGNKSNKLVDVLRTIKFNIPTSSTNTENPDRDDKIITSFFGSMEGTDLIIGQVKDAKGDNESGVCTFYLSLNNIEKEVTLDYKLDDTALTLTGELDLVDFGAEKAVAALNAVCGDLHKGEDGVSKTWSVVELAIETTLNKKCH